MIKDHSGVDSNLSEMGKTGKWLRNFLTGKKDRERSIHHRQAASAIGNHENNPTTTPISIPPATPKEKRRWSFRRSSATGSGQKELTPADSTTVPPPQQAASDLENEAKKHAMAVAVATAAAADAAVAAAQAAAAMIRLTVPNDGKPGPAEEAAALKIQSVFRSYLARKALCALKGLVKLQALVRGHLVRKQATATLRCMQALVTVQARARAQRIRMVEDSHYNLQRPTTSLRKSSPDCRLRHSYHDLDGCMEEDIKIVEMDIGESKGSTNSRNSSYSNNNPQPERSDHRLSTHYRTYSKLDNHHQNISPSPSAITDMSPRACSGHFEEYSIGTAQSSPQYYSAISKPDPSKIPFGFPKAAEYAESLYSDFPFFPNYMANTESSRAKVRSQSAPKQRPDSYERQPSMRRRPSIEGRNVPRAVRMQRSSSHVGSTAQNYHYPWSIKLDRSTVSLKDSECGSTSTVLTNANYCRSLVGFDVHGHRY